MTMKKVCVLLAVYNGERYLKEQIDSILKQKGVEVFLLIRDDGSKDNSHTILKEYEKLNNVEVIYGKNVGCADSFRGLLEAAYNKLSDVDYFAFSDQDDVWLPEKLSVACSVVEKMDETKPCVYCSNVLAVDAQLQAIGLRWKPEQTFINKAQSLVCSMAHGCTMLFNRKVVELFHKYPPRKLVLHDLWVMNMCMFLGDVYYDPKSYILYRQHGNNVLGAKNTLRAKLKSRWKSFKHLMGQHEKEGEANEMLYTLNEVLTDDDKEMIGIVANYRKSLSKRLKFLFGIGKYNGEIRRKKDNFWLYVRIIIGRV